MTKMQSNDLSTVSVQLLSLEELSSVSGGKKSSWYKQSYNAGKAYGALARDVISGALTFIL